MIKNGRPHPPVDVSQLKFYRGIKTFVKYLKQKRFRIFIITNQPDVSRKKITKKNVQIINNKIQIILNIDEVKTCFHDDTDGCSCRKPKIGLIRSLKKKYNLKLNKCFVVGDRWRDIDCGYNAGCKTIFIDREYNERLSKKYDYRFKSIQQLARTFYEKKIKH